MANHQALWWDAACIASRRSLHPQEKETIQAKLVPSLEDVFHHYESTRDSYSQAKEEPKHEGFTRFWKNLISLEMNLICLSKSSTRSLNKLHPLSFESEKRTLEMPNILIKIIVKRKFSFSGYR